MAQNQQALYEQLEALQKSGSMPDACRLYEELVGYDPLEDDPTLTFVDVLSTLLDYLVESLDLEVVKVKELPNGQLTLA